MFVVISEYQESKDEIMKTEEKPLVATDKQLSGNNELSLSSLSLFFFINTIRNRFGIWATFSLVLSDPKPNPNV